MKPAALVLIACLLNEFIAPGLAHASGRLQAWNEERAARADSAIDKSEKLASDDDTPAEIVERAIREFYEKDVVLMSRGDLDISMLTRGWYTHVKYGSKRVKRTANGVIHVKDLDGIVLKSTERPMERRRIKYSELDFVAVAEERRAVVSWLNWADGNIVLIAPERLDLTRLTKGHFAFAIYRMEGARTIVSGKVANKKPDRIVIRSVSNEWQKWEILHRDIDVIVGYRDRNPLESWLRERTDILQLRQADVSYFSRNDLEYDRLRKGLYAHVVYTSEGVRKIVSGRIVDRKADRIRLQSVPKPWENWRISRGEIETIVTWSDRDHVRQWLEKRRAVVQLYETTLTVLGRGELDATMLQEGTYANVRYVTDGIGKAVSGKIVEKGADHILIKSGFRKKRKIALGDIDTVVAGQSLAHIKSWVQEKQPRVRLNTRSISRRRVIGRFSGVNGDKLVVVSERGIDRIPLSSIDKFAVSTGRFRNTDLGRKIGLIICFVDLAPRMFVAARGGFDSEIIPVLMRRLGYLYGPVVLGSTLIGASIETERWVELSPQRLKLGIAPTRNGDLQAAVSLEF